MASEEIEQVAKSLGATLTRGLHAQVMEVPSGKVKEACAAVSSLPGLYHLSTITAVDNGDRVDLLYHFWKAKSFVTVRTKIPKVSLALDSISGILAAATLYEAEIQDLFGVTFVGNPYVGRRLLLPDSYPRDAPPPLRVEADPEKIRELMKLE